MKSNKELIEEIWGLAFLPNKGHFRTELEALLNKERPECRGWDIARFECELSRLEKENAKLREEVERLTPKLPANFAEEHAKMAMSFAKMKEGKK